MKNLRNSRWPLLIALAVGVAIVVGVAYLPGRSSGVQYPAAGGRYVEGVAGSPSKINPLFASFNQADADISSLVFSGLVRLGPNGSVRPDLAALPTIAPDGRTYVFRLRPDARWHDGQRVTSADVVFTVQLIQGQSFAGDPQLADLFRSVTAATFGDEVVVMTLPEPYAPFLARAGVVGILPEHILADVPPDQLASASFNQAPIGSGPFQVRRFTPNSVELTRFEQYSPEPPLLDEIDLRFYSDDAALLAALTSGEIAGALFRPGLDKRVIDAIDRDRRYVRRGLHGTAYSVMYLNQLIPQFSDDRLRRALQHGLNRAELVDAVLEGQAEPVDSPVALGLWSYVGSPEAYAYDKDLAARLLDQAGWTLRGDVRQNADGIPLRFHIEASDDPVQVVVAQEVARQWSELGAQVDVVVSGASQFVEGVLLRRTFHTALVSIDPGLDPDPYSFWHSTQAIGQGRNLASFSDSRIDQVLENARQTTSPAERAAAYREFQQVFAQLTPAVLLYTPIYQYVVSANIHGVSPGVLTAASARFNDASKWYMETASASEER